MLGPYTRITTEHAKYNSRRGTTDSISDVSHQNPQQSSSHHLDPVRREESYAPNCTKKTIKASAGVNIWREGYHT